jgi:hypothetical protein
VDGLLVALGRAGHAEGFVRSDVVEDLPVGLGLPGDGLAVGDLVAVQVLVLQRAEGALADPVLSGALGLDPDVFQDAGRCDERGEPAGLERWPVEFLVSRV